MAIRNEIFLIDTNKEVPVSNVISVTNRDDRGINPFVVGDRVNMIVRLLDVDGYSTLNGSSQYTLEASIRHYDDDTILARTDNFGTSGSYGWTGSINLNTNELTASISGEQYIEPYLGIRLTNTGGDAGKDTVLLTPIQIWFSPVTGSTYPVNNPEYLTVSESDARYLQVGDSLSSSFFQGGNTFGTTAVLGTKDTQALNILTNNTTRVIVESDGNVGIGTNPGADKLYVDGTIRAGSNITAVGNVTGNRVTGSVGIFSPLGFIADVKATRLTGSLFGTSSWASNARSASFLTAGTYAITSSWANNSRTASFLPSNTYLITSSWANNVSFSGKSDNYIPKWSSNVLTGTSNLYDDGTNVAIGGSSANNKLHVYGGANIAGNITGSNLAVSTKSTTKELVANTSSLNVVGVGTEISVDQSTHLIFGGSTTSKSQLRMPVGSSPTSPTTGDLWNGATGQINFRQNGATVIVPGVISRQTATVSRTAATSTAQQLFSPVVSLPADFLKATQVIKIKSWGYHNAPDAGTNTHSLAINMAISGAVQGVVNLSSFSAIVSTNTTNGYWMYDGLATVRSIGAAGSVVSDSKLDLTLGTTSTVFSNSSNGVVTVKTDEATALQLSVTFTDGDSSDNFLCQQAIIEVL